uniref:Leucine rich repeat containing G protein-coupled receptor 6 n=1 Tax=Varanus komodoensis TaxID=61221 RepID=A0A8D2LKP5_VARKO
RRTHGRLAPAGVRMDRPLPWWLFLASSGILQSVSLEQGAVPSCPSLCHCEEDGIMLSVDCSELALSSVPDGLSPLTAYLRLDANLISVVPEKCFEGLPSLRHLWLDDNALKEIPVKALNNLPALQAMTLALNQIWHIPDYAFQNLTSLVVLDLNYNELVEFPVAIRTLGRLQENIAQIDNVGLPLMWTELPFQTANPKRNVHSSFTISIINAVAPLQHGNICLTDIISVTQNAQSCGTTGQTTTSFNSNGIWTEDEMKAHFLNSAHQPPFCSNVTCAFYSNRDLTDNQLVTLPLAGLAGLTHLKLKGNPALSESFTKENFPKMRVLEVPYAYQCCAYGACGNFFKDSSPWDSEDMSPEDEDGHKRTLGLFPDDLDMDDFQLELEDSKLHPNIQCTPSPGPFKPCDHLFESWVIRLGVWLITLVSILCNGLVMVVVFASPGYLSPVKFVIGALAGANMLTGTYCAILAFMDAITFGHFAEYGARWETGAGCQVTGFLSVFASEASILLLTLAAVQCSLSVSCMRAYGKVPSFGMIKAGALSCLALSSVAAALPLFSVREYGASPLCLPYPLPDGKPSMLGYMVALVLANTFCFLIITGTYIRLYCNLLKGEFDSVWDCAMIKHVAWLIFINCLLYCPVAFLTFSSMLSLFLITPEVIKSVLLVVLPLPACLNPLLYLLFNPHFRDDLRLLRQKSQAQESCTQSYVSEDTEKSSYDSTQALVAFSDMDHIFEAPDLFGVPPRCSSVLDAYSFPSVTLIPCQKKAGARGHDSVFSTHLSCLADDELLIASESRDQARNSLHIAFFPTPPAPAFTSHL